MGLFRLRTTMSLRDGLPYPRMKYAGRKSVAVCGSFPWICGRNISNKTASAA